MISLGTVATATLCMTGLYALMRLRRAAQSRNGADRPAGHLWRRSAALPDAGTPPDALRLRKLAAMTANKLDDMQRQLTPMRDPGLNQRMHKVRAGVEALFATIRNDTEQLNMLARQLDDAVAGTQRFAGRQRAAKSREARDAFAQKLDDFCAACARETALRTPPRVVPARPAVPNAQTPRPDAQVLLKAAE